MSVKCGGCEAVVHDDTYMQCSRPECTKLYHLSCLALTREKYEALTEDYVSCWMCPECVSMIPKRNNSETPVRSTQNTIMDSTSFTPSSYVNTARGSRHCQKTTDTEDKLFEVLHEFRLEMKSRLDNQIKEYGMLKKRFVATETELREVRSLMQVLIEKANKVDELEARIEVLKQKNEQLESSLVLKNPTQGKKDQTEGSKVSFVNAVKQNLKTVVTNKVARKECVATKPTELQIQSTTSHENNLNINHINTDVEEKETEEGKWITINRRRNRYPNSEVKRGGSTGTNEIQGTERKKYLHVWRLQKDTIEENLEKHVKYICGNENVRGLRTKLEDFYAGVTASGAHLFAITETGCNESIHDAEIIPPSYIILRCDRADGRKQGGACLVATPRFELRRVSLPGDINIDKQSNDIVNCNGRVLDLVLSSLSGEGGVCVCGGGAARAGGRASPTA
ncbi:hypothetical protein HF086_011042 [Spodoptera exigua]|uniref:PHD-type domain-containing protein n=1 Tax=Spodoptera exigua TaxID=7107 RepID=A0A922MSB6_SPOEX|nr:hypothetical protein HF086_011042 [Spodoptera exigua]